MTRTVQSPIEAPRPGFSPAVAVGAGAAVVIGGLVLFAIIFFQDVTPVGLLTRDPSVTAEQPWYLGAASSLGIIGWAAATAFFALGALLVRRTDWPRSRSLGLAGLYSFLLLIDDFFLLHDDILLRAFGSERPTYAAYAVLGVACLAPSLRRLERSTTILLVAAVGAFGLSVAVDQLWASDSDLRLVVEDGFKFIGIWLWALFSLAMTTAAIEETMAANHA